VKGHIDATEKKPEEYTTAERLNIEADGICTLMSQNEDRDMIVWPRQGSDGRGKTLLRANGKCGEMI